MDHKPQVLELLISEVVLNPKNHIFFLGLFFLFNYSIYNMIQLVTRVTEIHKLFSNILIYVL